MGADRLSSPIHWLGNGFLQTLAVSIWGTQVLHTCTQQNPQFTVLYYESEDMQTVRTSSPLKHATQLYFHCRSSPLPHHSTCCQSCLSWVFLAYVWMPMGHKGSVCICVNNVCMCLSSNKHLRTHFNASEGAGFVYPPSLLLRDRRDELASSGWNSSSSQWPTNCMQHLS